VAFVSDRDGQWDVFLRPVAGGAAINITHTPFAREDTPVFSPDGSTLAFASDRGGDWDIYLMDLNGANVRLAIGAEGSDELHPAFTPDGSQLLFSSNRAGGNWDIYRAPIGGVEWTRLTDHPAADRFPTISANGTIAFRSERDGNSEIYLMDADGVRRLTVHPAFDGHPSITPDGSGVLFASSRTGRSGLYMVNPAGGGLVTIGQLPGWDMEAPRLTPDGQAVIYALRPLGGTSDLYLRPMASPLAAIAGRPPADARDRCDWEAGTLAYGWVHAWQATHRTSFLHWAQAWLDHCLPQKQVITHVNDGLFGYVALIMYGQDPRPEYLTFAQKVADYFMVTAPRTANGTLTHEEGTVWVDTLLGVVPFLMEMGRVSGNSLYTEEAITQIIQHAAYLQDATTGLYHHAWDDNHQAMLGPAYWGRGNGWALLAEVAALSAIPVAHPRYHDVLAIMQRQAAGLLPLQDPSGLWHTVVTRPDFYLETSATALIASSFMDGVHRGWLTAQPYGPAAKAAILGIWRQVAADGTVANVSAPTGPMSAELDYNAIPHHAMQLYGQGVALLALSPLVP
jgi:unsaturated rhamnogalacturonyl hydrolase